jgi:hypothetical protein
MADDDLIFDLDSIPTFYAEGVVDEEQHKADFRKALKITFLSIGSTIVFTLLAYLIPFN